ncbi:hypothetical protein BMF94_4289 [Rhodotorula taiwanensis]|uniref:GST N-terminal domain-containing protein n=1 Tax=Rhodotorula taiwanensis TaxID=741276 RepID=A0A2S5B6Q7_9BASI|nr:hypothetical protein BMF94_4289 [Rhodotorula taiwanensis]
MLRALRTLSSSRRLNTNAMAAEKVIFYDLVSTHEGPHPAAIPPNTWKGRLALLHKGVDFELKYLTFTELRAMAPKLGVERPVIPFIEFPDGKVISDSWNIAEWAEKEYPDKPSLWLPDAPAPVKEDDPTLKLAKNYAQTFAEGFAAWVPTFELSAVGIDALMPGTPETNPDKEYFRSDYKQRSKGAWQRLTSLDRDVVRERAKTALSPLEKVLAKSPFLCGDNSGFVDYVVYSRYAMMRSACPDECKSLWHGETTPNLSKWIERIETKFEAGLEEAFKRLPPM